MLFAKAAARRPGFNLALAAVVFTVGVVGLGVFTRLVDAGLGCPDWPGCYGHLTWPNEDHEVAAANARFPETPVEHEKTWPEMVHRYFAATLGLLIIGIVIQAWRYRREPEQPQKLPYFLLGLVILQGLFGKWTVTLKLWPQVVTGHLLGGFTTLSLLWLLTLRLGNKHWQLLKQSRQRLKPWALAALIATVGQIALGGWVSANYAALACTDFPTCHGEWWPQMTFGNAFNFAQEVGPNYLGGLLDGPARTAIHVSHRIGALVVSALVLLLAWRLWRLPTGTDSVTGGEHRWLAGSLLAVLLVQVSLGISNIVFSLPLAVAVAHNLVGALLLLVLVTVNYRVLTAHPPAQAQA